MSDKYMKEIEEILKQAEDVLPKDRRSPSSRPSRGPGSISRPMGRASGGRRLKISAAKLMLVSLALLLLALILGAAGVGNVVHFVVAGLVLFVIAYGLLFIHPGGTSYEKRWRGQPIDDRPTILSRFKRWLKS